MDGHQIDRSPQRYDIMCWRAAKSSILNFYHLRWHVAALALAFPLYCQIARAHAETPALVNQTRNNGYGAAISHPISWYTGDRGPLVFKGRSASNDVTFFITEHHAIGAAALHLRGINSASLIKGDSQLLVSLNGKPIQQIGLNGSSPNIKTTVDLPPADLRDGVNALLLSVTQKAAKGSETFSDPDLWTWISSKSLLSINYRQNPVPLTLANMRQALDRWGQEGSQIYILYDPILGHTPEPIMAIARSMARITTRHALLFTARPLDRAGIELAEASPAAVIILQLRSGMPSTNGTNAAEFSAMHNPAGGVLLTITADTSHALAVAAQLVGQRGAVWPNTQSATLRISIGSDHLALTKRFFSHPTYASFRTTGVPTQTEQGRTSQFAPVTFWNPDWGGHAILYLHMAYTAGGGRGSMVEALVNGKMVNTIPLTNPDGGAYPDYKLLIPQSALKVGRNRLVLRPLFHVRGVTSPSCMGSDFGHNLAVTVFSDSHLSIIGGAPVYKDNLAALIMGVYPIRTIAIADHTPATISAAVTFGAKLAQILPEDPLRLTLDPHPLIKPGVLILGAASHLPAHVLLDSGISMMGSSPAVQEPSNQIPYLPGHTIWHEVVAWVGGFIDKKAESAAVRPRLTKHLQPDRTTMQGFGNAAIMAVAGSREVSRASDILSPTIVVTATNDIMLAKAVDTLIRATVWQQISGEAAIVFPGKSHLQILHAMNMPVTTTARLGFLATHNPLITVLAVLSALVIVILLIRAFVALRRRRFHPSVKGVDER